MTDWQDISTAPKDGTEILAAYFFDLSGEMRGDYSLVRWRRNDWVARADGRDAIEAQGDCYTDYIEPFVTHWMPLPPPPKEGE